MYRKNTASQYYYFGLVAASDGSALTGATVTGKRSIDGGAQASVTGTITEDALGQYHIAFSAADLNGNNIGFIFTATGGVLHNVTIVTTAADPTDSVRFGLSAIPNGPTNIKKNQALTGFPFAMFNSSGSPLTGLTVTAQRSLDGGAFASCANAVAELSGGWYKITLAAGDMNGTTIALKFTATGALDSDITIVTQP